MTKFQFGERYFFIFLLPIAIAIEWAFATTLDWSQYPRSEWVLLFDLCIFMPLLHLLFFSSNLTGKQRLVRMLGVSSIGLFAASFIVPVTNQYFISTIGDLRNILFVFVVLVEIFFFSKVVKAIFLKNADAKELEQDFAIPNWVAKLMIMEARFWKAIWGMFRRK